jgi:hypothetical protein
MSEDINDNRLNQSSNDVNNKLIKITNILKGMFLSD